MKRQGDQKEDIEKLEADRLVLQERNKRFFPFFLMTPIVIFLSTLFAMQVFPLAFGLGFGTAFLSILIYHLTFQAPFKALSSEVKKSLLAQFMGLYHPNIKYIYSNEKKGAKTIIRNSGLISADKYKEEDVLQGKMKDVSFYISEVDLWNQNKNSSHSIFKGILFKLKIPGKNFPNSQIQSKPNLLTRLFNKFTKHEEFGFWYASQNDSLFLEQLETIFPFIRHLVQYQGDVRIATKGDEITLLLKSDMKFLDDPNPQLDRSFLHEKYHAEIGKQLNSLLFIVEAFSSNLSSSQIEEQLELKERALVMKPIELSREDGMELLDKD